MTSLITCSTVWAYIKLKRHSTCSWIWWFQYKCHWRAVQMNYVAKNHVSVWLWSFLYWTAAGIWGSDQFHILQSSDCGLFGCAALWLIIRLPTTAAGLLSGRTARYGRFIEAQTLLLLHSHKTLTYLLCRRTGRQASSQRVHCPWNKQLLSHIGWSHIIDQLCVCCLPDTDEAEWF